MSEQDTAVAQPTADEAIEQTEAQTETEAQESQTEGQAPEGDKPEGTEETGERKRETAKERRERQRAAREKQEADLKDAQARLDRIKKAGQGIEAPSRDKFDDPDEYLAASAAYNAANAVSQREEAMAKSDVEEAQQRQQQAAAQEWEAKIAEGRERYSDFDAKVGNPNLPIAPHVGQAIIASEMGADVAYHLASNPDQAFRLSQMDPMSAAMEIGRLEAVLSVPPPKTEPKAPAPIETVEGAAMPSGDPSKMTPDQYRAWRQSGGSF